MQTPTNKPESGHLPKWMTKELIDETISVWSKLYGKALDVKKAVEILQTFGRLIDVLK
jgi:hypothetical protein